MSDAPLGSEHKWAITFSVMLVTVTANRRAMAMLYRETVTQASILAYADDFWLLLVVYSSVLLLIPFMRRVRSRQVARGRRGAEGSESGARDPGLPAPGDQARCKGCVIRTGVGVSHGR